MNNKITLIELAAAAGPVHPVTIKRWTKSVPGFPQAERLPNGHLVFDRRAAMDAVAKHRSHASNRRPPMRKPSPNEKRS